MKRRTAGYSLFEVLIAFAILTTVLATLIPGQAQLLTRVTQQDDKFLAQDYAYSVASQIGVTNPFTKGTQTRIYRKWQVTEDVIDNSLEGIDAELFQITVTVKSHSGKTLAHIETIRGIK